MSVSHVSARHHAATFGGLLLLATGSLLLGLFTDWPYLDVVIGVGIAFAKSLLVIWFFMHMAEQPFRTRLATTVATLLVVLLISLTVVDVTTREVIPERSSAMPRESFYRR